MKPKLGLPTDVTSPIRELDTGYTYSPEQHMWVGCVFEPLADGSHCLLTVGCELTEAEIQVWLDATANKILDTQDRMADVPDYYDRQPKH